jgi:hypothetical protein
MLPWVKKAGTCIVQYTHELTGHLQRGRAARLIEELLSIRIPNLRVRSLKPGEILMPPGSVIHVEMKNAKFALPAIGGLKRTAFKMNEIGSMKWSNHLPAEGMLVPGE